MVNEVTAPAGYELADPVTFTVGEDGTLTLAGGSDAAWSVAADGGTAVLTAKDEPVEITIAKQGELADGTTGPLAGAESTLEPAEGSAFADGSSDPVALAASGEDGSIDVPSATLVASGTYVLREAKAPAGYELIEGAFTFTVADDGTVSAAEGTTPPAAFEITDGGVSIVATDEPIEGTLVKVSATSDTAEGEGRRRGRDRRAAARRRVRAQARRGLRVR